MYSIEAMKESYQQNYFVFARDFVVVHVILDVTHITPNSHSLISYRDEHSIWEYMQMLSSHCLTQLINFQACPESQDFRAAQCAAFDEVPYDGQLYKWTTHYDYSEPCALTCRYVIRRRINCCWVIVIFHRLGKWNVYSDNRIFMLRKLLCVYDMLQIVMIVCMCVFGMENCFRNSWD